MTKRSERKLDQIRTRLVGLIQEHPDGLSRSEIQKRYEARFGEQLPTRSVIRWLNQLDNDDRITIEGAKRNRRYLPAPDTDRPDTEAGVQPEGGDSEDSSTEEDRAEPEDTILLSSAAKKVRTLIRRPAAKREPVTYNREFLDSYDPESRSTWYLSSELRDELAQMGKTPDAKRPTGTYARNVLEPLLIDLSWSSSRLEGNTYSRVDTEELIKEGKRAADKDPKEAQMILNHKAAIEHLVENPERSRFDRFTLRTLHAKLSENLMGDPGREAALRTGDVRISDSTYTPIAIPQVIAECFDVMLAKAAAIPDPYEQSFFIMVHLPYLQPFWDVNKRTARIAANIPLFKQNLIPLSFIDVPREQYLEATLAIYELNRIKMLRDVFEWAYRRSCKRYGVIRESLGEPPPDPIRLQYRDELGEAVRRMVRTGTPPRVEALRAYGDEREDVAPQDVDEFADRAVEVLRNLNEGTAGRYGIAPEDLEAWRAEVSEHL